MTATNELDLVLMLLLGLTSSLHCVTMCGPLIAVASAPLTEGREAATTSRLALWQGGYHLGRGVTYVIIGGVLGLAGTALTALFATRLVGGVIQLGVGLLIVCLGIWQLWRGARPASGGGVLTGLLRRALTRGRVSGMIALGLLTGLLPCGVLYAAFARAVATRSMAEGATVMFAFWLGTVPLLAALGLLSGHFFQVAGRFSRVLLCLAMLATGGWLGLKGITNLGAAPPSPARAACHGHGG